MATPHPDAVRVPGLWTPSTKFALLGLDDSHTVNFTDPTVVTDGVSAHTRCPLAVPDHWHMWLGTLIVGHLEQANFVLVIHRPSATPNVIDPDTQHMELDLDALWFGVLLHGVPDYRNGLRAFGGVTSDDTISVRRLQRVDTAYRHRFGEPLVIDGRTLASARTIAGMLLDLHRSGDFRRVRHGFKACVRGLQEPLPEERFTTVRPVG